ncbi:MAG: hypothetical protein FWF18_05245 [Dehalococcoidia bacterium]|nr:hypothetical protein [Dehalococcoidia bacterium]
MKQKKDLNEVYEDELEIEAYSPHELKSKKRNIVARVAIAGVVVVAAIGIAGLAINFHLNKSGNDINVVQTTTENESENDINVVQTTTGWDYTDYVVLGGSGSWFLSRMERFDG